MTPKVQKYDHQTVANLYAKHITWKNQTIRMVAVYPLNPNESENPTYIAHKPLGEKGVKNLVRLHVVYNHLHKKNKKKMFIRQLMMQTLAIN
jgi:hypothetical protein